MLEFEILAQGCYLPEQLLIDYRPEQRIAVTPTTQEEIDRSWQQKLHEAQQKGTLLYDAALFRFVSIRADLEGTLQLLLGDTSYKEYVATRMPEFTAYHAREELSNALSVCSVVETRDGYMLLDKREGVDTYAGRYHVIGGFMVHTFDRDAQGQPDPFAAMLREIREETGVQTEDVREQICLGIVYDLTLPHAELCFLIRLHIPLAVVMHERTPEDQEIRHLQSLQITAPQLRNFIIQHHGNISPSGEPNMLLYGAYRFGPSWFTEVMNSIG
ncbi:MAG TPA: NUDIX hydrolase [Ktedonobacteraceae bacterium]